MFECGEYQYLSLETLFGASVSEPLTSEFNGEISLVYIIYAYARRMRLYDLTTRAYQDVLLNVGARGRTFGLGSWSVAFTH